MGGKQAQQAQREANAHYAQEEGDRKTELAQEEPRGSAAPSFDHLVRRLVQVPEGDFEQRQQHAETVHALQAAGGVPLERDVGAMEEVMESEGVEQEEQKLEMMEEDQRNSAGERYESSRG